MRPSRAGQHRGPIPGAWVLLAVVVLSPLLATTGLSRSDDPKAEAAAGPSFKPVPLPDPHIPGYHFPEPEATILGWVGDSVSSDPKVQAEGQQKIRTHAWGIWTALTADSGETFEGQNLRVFDTWLTPQNVFNLGAGQSLTAVARRPFEFRKLNQLRRPTKRLQAQQAGEDTVIGFVKYDPSTAEHLVREQLLHKSVLDSLLANGQDSVPALPMTGVSLKPVYQPLGSGKLVISGKPGPMIDGHYYPLAVWPGPPNPAKAFPQSLWPTWVWIDVRGAGAGNGKVITLTPPGPPAPSTIKPDVTYGVGKLINFHLLSATDVASINAANVQQAQDAPEVVAGDWAVLVGMHVTSREITRWTWQTFWWLPNADSPSPPSSKAIADDRPAQLKGAPRSYAMAPAYSMVLPQQPNTGGANTGESVYAYNPYLEAPFSPLDLPASLPGYYQGKLVANNVGVQTNCMSCHAMASYARGGTPDLTATLYTGDRYVDLQGLQFRGNLKADFLWSIPVEAK